MKKKSKTNIFENFWTTDPKKENLVDPAHDPKTEISKKCWIRFPELAQHPENWNFEKNFGRVFRDSPRVFQKQNYGKNKSKTTFMEKLSKTYVFSKNESWILENFSKTYFFFILSFWWIHWLNECSRMTNEHCETDCARNHWYHCQP